ncbi:MAG: glycoside hydrolase family 3 protein [Anaerolineae bacterium]
MRLFHFFLASVSLSFAIPSSAQDDSWAQKTLQKMSLDEKIGQLFMIAGYVDPEYASREIGNSQIIQEIDPYITEYHVGGIAYVGPSEYAKQIALTNHYQEISKVPILIAQDLEWGLSMRIKDGLQFPKNITLGAIDDNGLIYEMGKEIGNQAKLVGVHMNLSPVLDVNIEPENIVINVRSFGSSPQQVAEKGVAMIRGLQDAGIIASAKHFPGLGDIFVDPHLALPCSKHGRKRLQDVELYPFDQAIKAGVLSIQTEHLMVPSLESDPKTPSSLSPKIVNDLLKKEMGFTGLVLSGALRMKALTTHLSDEEIVLKAFLAGSDMLLMPQDFPKAYQTLKTALTDGKITEKDVNERVLKILQMKEKVKLDRQCIVAVPRSEQLHSPFAKALKKRLYRSAISLTRDHEHLVPLSLSKKNSVAYIQLGDAPSTDYLEKLSQSLTLDAFIFPLAEDNSKEEQRLLQQIDKYSLVILTVYPADPRRIVEIRLLNEKHQKEELKHFRVHGIPESLVHLADILERYQKKTIVTFFGNPFGIHFFNGYSTLIMGYEADPDAQQAVIDILMGQCNPIARM